MNIALHFAEAAPYYSEIQTSTASDTASAGIIGAVIFMTAIFTIAIYAVMSILLGRIFQKAGVQSWKAWIPVYNNWILLQLGDQKGYWAIVMLIPVVNIISVIFMYIAYYNIDRKLGKEEAFILLAIFLPLVWMAWLALDKSTWKGAPKKVTHAK